MKCPDCGMQMKGSKCPDCGYEAKAAAAKRPAGPVAGKISPKGKGKPKGKK